MPGTAPAAVGIDFGTSNSAVATLDAGGSARLVPLEGGATAMPTALFFNAEDGTLHFGREAVALYLAGVEGRLLRSLKKFAEKVDDSYRNHGLANAIVMLGEFLSGVTPQEMRKKMRDEVNSSNRKFKITGTPDSHGSYPVKIGWTMFPCDITSQPVEQYKDNIRAWSRSIYEALKVAGVAS